MSTKEKHLYYLSELKDYKVDSKDQDIRGWTVKDIDNRSIGKVDNLLVNKEIGKVVYIDVEVEQSIINLKHDPYAHSKHTEFSEFINKDGENHIIIPIGLIELNKDEKHVITESIYYETFAETKRYKSGTSISRDYERHVLGSYDRKEEDQVDYSKSEIKRTATAYEHERKDSDLKREKENLKYSSDERKRAVTDNNKTEILRPERTLDDDREWVRDESEIDNGSNTDTNPRRRDYDEDNTFYDKKEFQRKQNR